MAHIYMILSIAVLLFLTVNAHQLPSTQPIIQPNLCKWCLKVTTGSDEFAATNATISLDIQVPNGGNFSIPDLNTKNRNRDPNYLPFRQNGVDYFDFKGPCSSNICNITFGSDGTGVDPAWQLESVAANITFLAILPVKQYPTVIVGDFLPGSPPRQLTLNLCTGTHTLNPEETD